MEGAAGGYAEIRNKDWLESDLAQRRSNYWFITNSTFNEGYVIMDKIVYFISFIANIILLAFSFFTFLTGYGEDRIFSVLLMIPAIFSIFEQRIGPDLEERKLTRQLNKARMSKELQDLENKTAGSV